MCLRTDVRSIVCLRVCRCAAPVAIWLKAQGFGFFVHLVLRFLLAESPDLFGVCPPCKEEPGKPAMACFVHRISALLLLCFDVLLTVASADDGASLRGSRSELCTAYSQCGGQNWSGCAECPGQQVCRPNGQDPWTKVCVDPAAELGSESLQCSKEGELCSTTNWPLVLCCPGLWCNQPLCAK